MWQEWAFYWLSPFTLAMVAWLMAGVCLAWRRRKFAVWLAALAFCGLWIGSMPIVANRMLDLLEGDYEALTPQATPQADAIVVLGGALVAAHPPYRPTFLLGPASSRVWHAAALYRAGKAKWVVVAAGNRPALANHQVEADAIKEMLLELRVPPEAIVTEGKSRNTRENAANIKPLLIQLGARRVLLVTSAQHMTRAMKTFGLVWSDASFQLIPAVTDRRGGGDEDGGAKVWLPSLDALITVTKSLKEFAGLAALAIIGDTS